MSDSEGDGRKRFVRMLEWGGRIRPAYMGHDSEPHRLESSTNTWAGNGSSTTLSRRVAGKYMKYEEECERGKEERRDEEQGNDRENDGGGDEEGSGRWRGQPAGRAFSPFQGASGLPGKMVL